MEYRLLEKTELWISPVKLSGADLGLCAEVVARALGLEKADVMVTDALGDKLTLDILVPTVRAEQIVSKEKALLEALESISGVTVFPETRVHSEGVLGLISLDEDAGKGLLQRSKVMRDEISARVAARAVVMATGAEVLEGQIEDTNTPYLVERLRGAGFDAVAGPVLADNAALIVRALRLAAEQAYGLVVTTGGVGAEGKDQTLEALSLLDDDAATPYVLKFQKGQGRHQKDGVRIGVGRWGHVVMVCLPGPHDEVELLWPILERGLHEKWVKSVLADALATGLREKFLSGGGHHPLVTERIL
ncbi:MAG: molybdopterin-binding protein [Deltaproteobacteria bacterium]